jgi:beta-phosphoglucomutase-like phosphatase (HAD superfamily)
VQAGKAAGMKVVAVPNEYTRRMDFSSADKVVDSLSKVSHSELSKLFTA